MKIVPVVTISRPCQAGKYLITHFSLTKMMWCVKGQDIVSLMREMPVVESNLYTVSMLPLGRQERCLGEGKWDTVVLGCVRQTNPLRTGSGRSRCGGVCVCVGSGRWCGLVHMEGYECMTWAMGVHGWWMVGDVGVPPVPPAARPSPVSPSASLANRSLHESNPWRYFAL